MKHRPAPRRAQYRAPRAVRRGYRRARRYGLTQRSRGSPRRTRWRPHVSEQREPSGRRGGGGGQRRCRAAADSGRSPAKCVCESRDALYTPPVRPRSADRRDGCGRSSGVRARVDPPRIGVCRRDADDCPPGHDEHDTEISQGWNVLPEDVPDCSSCGSRGSGRDRRS
jgi:hypothetical protein